MSDFSYLDKFDVKHDQTVTYKIQEIELNYKTPELYVLPATQKNAPYFNSVLKAGKPYERQVKSGSMTTELMSISRDIDRELYAVHVIKGWNNIFDKQGQPVEFTQDACKEFLKALPDWIFDNLTIFCKNPNSFVGAANIDLEDLGNG